LTDAFTRDRRYNSSMMCAKMFPEPTLSLFCVTGSFLLSSA
jgi:hypothetical protein